MSRSEAVPGITGAGRPLSPAHEVVERGLESSRGDGCVVIVYEQSEAEVRFANNTTTTNGTRRDRRIGVVSLRAGPDGYATGVASGSGGLEVEELVRAAETDAAGAAPAEDASDLWAGSADNSFADPPPETDVGRFGHVITGLGDAFARARATDRLLAGFVEHNLETVYLGTSTGLRRRHVQPTGRLQLVARSADGTRSAWAGAGAADLAELRLEVLEERLARRLGWAERQVELDAGRYETVLPPDATADLMCMAGEAASGRDAEDGRNVFAAPGGRTRVGEELSALPFELRSDPAEPELECLPFIVAGASGTDVSVFDNGMPLGLVRWIGAGKLEQLRYHRAASRRSGVTPAAPIDNLVLELPGVEASVDDLVAHVHRGLLLTCLWYIREVDPATLLLTGLTRDGVYLIEKGEITGAVNNFRFNESPIDLLARTVEAGRSERALSREWNEWFPRTAMPALLVADFNMSSVSPAT